MKNLALYLSATIACLFAFAFPDHLAAQSGAIATEQDNQQFIRLSVAGDDVGFCPAGGGNNYHIYLIETIQGVPQKQSLPSIPGVQVHSIKAAEGTDRVAVFDSVARLVRFYRVTGSKGARTLTPIETAEVPPSLGNAQLSVLHPDTSAAVLYSITTQSDQLVRPGAAPVRLSGWWHTPVADAAWITHALDSGSRSYVLTRFDSRGAATGTLTNASLPIKVERATIWYLDTANSAIQGYNTGTLGGSTSLTIPRGFQANWVVTLPTGFLAGGVDANSAFKVINWDRGGRLIYQVPSDMGSVKTASADGAFAVGWTHAVGGSSPYRLLHIPTGAYRPVFWGDPTVDFAFLDGATGVSLFRATYWWDGIEWLKPGMPSAPIWTFPPGLDPVLEGELFVRNLSYETLCREVDNLRYYLCRGGTAGKIPMRINMSFTPPPQPWGTDRGAAFQDCSDFSGPATTESVRKVFDDGLHWINGYTVLPAAFRPDFSVRVNGSAKGKLSYITIGRRIADEASYPTLAAIYGGTEVRVTTQPEKRGDPGVPFGSTVILGPMNLPKSDSDRAYADIDVLDVWPHAYGINLKITFKAGGSLTAFLSAERGKSKLIVDTEYFVGPEAPAAAITSMYRDDQSHDANVLGFTKDLYRGSDLFSDSLIAGSPSAAFPGAGTLLALGRETASDHNSGSPNHALEIIAERSTGPILTEPTLESKITGFTANITVKPTAVRPVWQASVGGVLSKVAVSATTVPVTVSRPGVCKVMLRTYSSVAPAGWSSWSTLGNVTLTGVGQATLISPQGTTTGTQPTLSWLEVPGATYYVLRLTSIAGVRTYTVRGATNFNIPVPLKPSNWSWTATPFNSSNQSGLSSTSFFTAIAGR